MDPGRDPAYQARFASLQDRRMSRFSPSTLSAAMALIGQYGDDAEIIATMRAAELAAQGDTQGLADWDDIIACIAAIEAGEGPRTTIQ